MPALNFKQEFAEKIADGSKTQTVRKPRKDGRPHAKPGDKINLYTGMRTKECRLLCEARVTSVRPVTLDGTSMTLGGREMRQGEGNQYFDPETFDNDFARADGFDEYMDMAAWFDERYGLPFKGVVIQWDFIR